MSKKDLIPFNKMSKERAREIQSKGGRTVSPQKKLSAKLRELRKRGLTDDTSQRLYEILTDSELDSLDTRIFLENIKEVGLDISEKLKLGNLLISWHKAHFGEKRHQINVNLDANESLRDLKEFLRDKQPLKK